jgi:hypothetical protein
MVIMGLPFYTTLYIAGTASSILAVYQLVPARQEVLPALSGSAAGLGGFCGQANGAFFVIRWTGPPPLP